MIKTVKWSEEEFGINYSAAWEQTVEIIYWEHNFENKFYIIKYKEKIN